MTQRLQVAVVALLVVTSMAAPAGAFVGPLAGDAPATPDVAQRFGEPSFIVEFSTARNDTASDLRDWAAGDGDRHVVEMNASEGRAVLAAPRLDVTASGLDRLTQVRSLDDLRTVLDTSPLAAWGYVERVQPNYQHSLPRSVDVLEPESNASTPTLGLVAFDDPEYPLNGVAFSEDANRTTMAESRSILGVDNVSARHDGSGTRIAIVDTGANTADGRVFGNGTPGSEIRIANASKNLRTGATVNESGYDAIADGNGHGTWTAAAAAANTSNDTHDGIAPGAELLVLKALSDDGGGSTSDIADAIRYAADHDADVVSMSLGSPIHDEAIADAIDYAYAHGVDVVTVAAGNSRQLRSPGIASPGDHPDVVTVGATNGSEPPQAWSAYFSQYGPDRGVGDLSMGATRGASIDVVAPGMATVARIPVSDSVTETTLSQKSGTSMATPMVAGGAALVLDARAAWSNETVRKWLRKGARPVPHAAATEVGHGMLAVDNTIQRDRPENASQSAAQTTAATARESFHRALAADTDGFLPLAVLADQPTPLGHGASEAAGVAWPGVLAAVAGPGREEVAG